MLSTFGRVFSSMFKAPQVGEPTRSNNANSTTTLLNQEAQQRTERPAELADIFARARDIKKESRFLRAYFIARLGLINYGLELVPGPDEKGEPPADNAAEELGKWLNSMSDVRLEEYTDPRTQEKIEIENLDTNGDRIRALITETINDVMLFDTSVGFWLDGQAFAYTLPVEKCDFSDKLGYNILKYTHGLSNDDIALLETTQQERFRKSGIITLNPAEGEHFRVFKTNRIGDGFPTPSIFSLFRTYGEVENKEVGMNTMAFAMRKVTRMHKLGHEIKNGERAGKPLHFWSKKRSDMVKELWTNVVGLDDYTCNFDEDVVFPWPDMKVFDETCWKGTNLRMAEWGGPMAMLMTSSLDKAPFLAPLLKAEIIELRAALCRHLTRVINAAWKPKVPITMTWGNTIFNESRLAAEMIKFAAQQGWVSVETGREETGLNNQKENARKLAEAKDSDSVAKHRPMWDSSHGISPASGETSAPAKGAAGTGPDPGSTNGRPTGSQTSN